MNGALDLLALKRERGGQLYDAGRRWVGPGPGHSRHDRSLSVAITDEGRPIIHSFAGDPFRACADHLGLAREARPASWAELAKLRKRREAERRAADADAERFARGKWTVAEPIAATPAETWLWRRALIYDGGALRFHSAAPRSRAPDGPKPHPAMVALVQQADGRPLGLHATYITPDGRKAFGDRSRLMFGRTSQGAVRLAEFGRDGVLAVAEGIETALAFAALKGVPTWAALSTSGLRMFNAPAGVRRVIIAADSDDAGAGLSAARELAERHGRSCAVTIDAAPAGKDWCDAWREAAL